MATEFKLIYKSETGGSIADHVLGEYASEAACYAAWDRIKGLPVPPSVEDGYPTETFQSAEILDETNGALKAI